MFGRSTEQLREVRGQPRSGHGPEGVLRPGLAAVEDHKNYLVLGLFAAVVDYKEIQSLTHLEDSVEDRRTTDLAWLTQQDQD